MDSYYVNKNPQRTGEHEVHRSICSHLPSKENLIHLGTFSDCVDALIAAKKLFPTVDGCRYCCIECHHH